MSLFNFLKKKELAEINRLKIEIARLQGQIASLEKYQGIIDAEAKISEMIANADKEKENREQQIRDLDSEIELLKQKYSEGYITYEKLKKETDIFRDSLEMSEYGVYEPHFEFDTSEQYKNEIFGVRERQKQMIRTECAVKGGENILWNNSLSQGQAMVKREKKLMLRAFNGECDSFVSDVEWNNVARMEERIEKSFDAINKIYEKQGISISRIYKSLKLNELHLAYEYKRKKYEEKEEQRAIREQMREEEKARREIEVALIKAQKEEETFQKALDKARAEVQTAQGAVQSKLESKIAELEARVAEAEANKERAMSMAQQTRRGHVYVISNIGSFGEDVYKIGMTRRLDPMDRVKELGDASVPFPFDVHAMIFCEDAPALENALHKKFDQMRLNLINQRKEFFKVTLEQIEKAVHENGATIEFTKIAEARDFRESQAARSKKDPEEPKESMPAELFAS